LSRFLAPAKAKRLSTALKIADWRSSSTLRSNPGGTAPEIQEGLFGLSEVSKIQLVTWLKSAMAVVSTDFS
jgi:hypothetical protein